MGIGASGSVAVVADAVFFAGMDLADFEVEVVDEPDLADTAVDAQAELAPQPSASTPISATSARFVPRNRGIVRGYPRPPGSAHPSGEVLVDERRDIANRPLLRCVRDVHPAEDQRTQ